MRVPIIWIVAGDDIRVQIPIGSGGNGKVRGEGNTFSFSPYSVVVEDSGTA